MCIRDSDYTVAGAMQIFASPVSKGLSVYSIDGNATGNITIYPMKTIWTDKLTPTKPLSVGVDKTNINGYVGDEFTLNSWVSPAELSQDLIYTCLLYTSWVMPMIILEKVYQEGI